MRSQADGFIERARIRLDDARKALELFRLDVSISNSIESIELSAKATFLLLDTEYPKSHDFDDAAVAALFERLPEQATHSNFPRLFVLHELWRSFYTLSKYGKDRWSIPASDLFKNHEAELAAAHASEWSIAVNVLRSVIQHY
jgi:HEPN domain-containing protein